jgi:orotate phosphoribosyltransferase
MEDFKESFIRNIISWGVMKFAPDREHYFTLKSGRKSPYFANMANAMNSGDRLDKTGTSYARSVGDSYFTVAHGPSMKGIPLVPVIAAEMQWHGGINYAFDFKEGPQQIMNDALIGVKLRREKKDLQILDTLDTGMLSQRDCNGYSAIAMAEDLREKLLRNYDLDKIDCVVGKAYGGIVPAALLVRQIAREDNKDLRFVYDRISGKNYGVTSESNFVGDLREGDRVLVVDGRLESVGGVFGRITADDTLKEFDDVITTGKAKRESKHKVEKFHPKAKWNGVNVGVYRGEVDETGQTVQQSLEEHGLSPLGWIVDAKEIFDFAHNREIDGKVYVDGIAYDAFLGYMGEFGAKS